MNVLTNSEFENLVVDQTPRLKAIARQRSEQDPSGFLKMDDIQEYAKVCAYSGDQASSKWLKNLAVVYKNGTLQRIRTGKTTWEDHAAHVNKLYAAGEVKFNIGQHVFVEDEGRYGSVVDYMPDSKEYLVVLDPFQVKQFKKKDLEKVAQLGEPPEETSELGEEELRPEEDDAFFFPTGHLGGATGLSVGGKFIGKFSEQEEAENALREWAEKNQYWPNVWYVSDHGNVSQVTGFNWTTLKTEQPAEEGQKEYDPIGGGGGSGRSDLPHGMGGGGD